MYVVLDQTIVISSWAGHARVETYTVLSFGGTESQYIFFEMQMQEHGFSQSVKVML